MHTFSKTLSVFNGLVIFSAAFMPLDLSAQEQQYSTRQGFQRPNARDLLSLESEVPGPEERAAITALEPEMSEIALKQVPIPRPTVVHRRLIFEEMGLERVGESKPEWRQVATSGVHFFSRGIALPFFYPTRRARACEACGQWWYSH